ncbi:VTT domain-containing protein [Hyphomonas sp. WL0036]|uniref:DedA family protein n=1 Tax=Hyphomonas sediminis TaxID=2866160 RepID=UPI001C8053F1|nr:VTT domain-containing protein [Hyphomonas sediminis]MBY9068049.1 VTT domain-containing protein [Hyphomonas sediminis]
MTLSLVLTLFFGAFFDATLGTCFFVFGEAFFLMAGGLLFTEKAVWAVIAVFAGAYAADQTGYLIGRQMRPWFHRFVLAKSGRRAVLRKTRRLLRQHGIKAVAASRLLGPVAWFMPPVCGSAGMPWQRFAVGSALGVALGVGMFVTLGWAIAWGASQGDVDVEGFIRAHKWALLAGGQAVFVLMGVISHFVGNALFRRV